MFGGVPRSSADKDVGRGDTPAGNVVSGERSYRENQYWQRYQTFFPGGLRVTPDNAPTERWWFWRGLPVHLDRVDDSLAPAKLIMLHGAGSYGRMLAPYTRLPSVQGLEIIAPDLPGYGLTGPSLRAVNYRMWVDCVADLVAAERRVDDRPVVLLGVSIGGRLAYDVAVRRDVSGVPGVIATCLLDPRRSDVRTRIASHWAIGRVAGLLPPVPFPLGAFRVPIRWVANMAAVSNQTQLSNLVAADPLGGGNSVSLRFLRSYVHSAPIVEPEKFDGPPLLLAHPEADLWTPKHLSLAFFDRLRGPKRFAVLGGAGHLPVEETGLADLDSAVRDFLDELGVR